MPAEGLDYQSIPELRRNTAAILKSEKYKTLTRKYNLGHSRVSSLYY